MALDKQRIREMLDQVANTKGQASVDRANDLLVFLSAEKSTVRPTEQAQVAADKDLEPVSPVAGN